MQKHPSRGALYAANGRHEELFHQLVTALHHALHTDTLAGHSTTRTRCKVARGRRTVAARPVRCAAATSVAVTSAAATSAAATSGGRGSSSAKCALCGWTRRGRRRTPRMCWGSPARASGPVRPVQAVRVAAAATAVAAAVATLGRCPRPSWRCICAAVATWAPGPGMAQIRLVGAHRAQDELANMKKMEVT